MNFREMLFKRVGLVFFFLITFFCISCNVFAASFAYDRFNWESFLEQHREYWSGYCRDGSQDCIDEILKTKEKFYTRLYELLSEYDRKGYFIDDNIIIETVFFGLTPDSFADKDKIEPDYVGQEIESGYTIDETSDKDKYIASDDGNKESAKEYFKRETDSLKALLNNMIGYYRECYGYSGESVSITGDDGSTSLGCSDPNASLIDGKCWNRVHTIKTNFFDSIGLSALFSNNTYEKECQELTADYPSYLLGDASNGQEVNEEIYWDFLIHNVYFDNKFQLQEYFKEILYLTGHESMTELSSDEYKLYEDKIVEARTRIVNNIKDIIGSYGKFAETPTSGWVYVNESAYSYSSGSNNYWWPIGGSEITTDGNIQMAVGEPTNKTVTSKFGYRTYPKTGMHLGVDIAGVTGVENVIASKSGIVVYSSKTSGDNCPDSNDVTSTCGGTYGNRVTIQHNDGSYTLYAHLARGSVLVEVGDSVIQGQLIGKVGSSGSSTGGHLHFEVRIGGNSSNNVVDPLLYISKDEPRKTGGGYAYDDEGNVISDGSLSNAIQYIHSWEGTPKSEGNDYIAVDDGYGFVTIGWGVVPKFNKAKFQALGVDPDKIVVGSRVSKDIVDLIELQIVQGMADTVKSMLSNNGLTLESYQIDALISRTYNCGSGGLTGFPKAYKEYGTTEAMYDNFMYKPNTSSGQLSRGLQRRRRAEYLLFSEAEYNITV